MEAYGLPLALMRLLLITNLYPPQELGGYGLYGGFLLGVET